MARPSKEAMQKMVRAEGLEPPWLTPLEPKSSVSTNSTTPAGHTSPGGRTAGAGVYNTVASADTAASLVPGH